MNESKRESVMNKIKGLLAVVSDGANESEVQNAIMLAQKLMAKYSIEQSEVEEIERSINDVIESFAMTEPTTSLKWYEKELSSVVASNFKTKAYIMNKYIEQKKKKVIMLMGMEEDCYLTQEIFFSTLINMMRLGKEYKEVEYMTTYRYEKKTAKLSNVILDSYYKGFIAGLIKAFDEQKEEFKEESQEYAMAIVTPAVVDEKWKQMSENMKYTKAKKHNDINIDAYERGKKDGAKSRVNPLTKIEG